MKTLSANLLAAVTALTTRPIWLVQVDFGSPIRHTSDQVDVTFDGNAFTAADVRCNAVSIGSSGINASTIYYQAVDLAFISVFRAAGVEGTPVRVWLTDKVSTLPTLAAADAIQIIDSTIDQVIVTPTSVQLNLSRQPVWAPTERVDEAHGFTDVTGPTTNLPSGTS